MSWTLASGMTSTPPAWAGLADVHPDYGSASLADIMPSVLAALGLPGATDPLRLAGPLDAVQTVAVLLVDGLGYHMIARAGTAAPTLAALIAPGGDAVTARAITAGFPSTTPTSLASLGTGAPPGLHGLLGFTLAVPGTDRILTHIDWWDDPDPLRWQPLPTQFDRAAAAGISAYVVNRSELADSGLSIAAYRGGLTHPASGDLVEAMLNLVASARAATIVYGYHSDLDRIGHLYGLDSPQWIQAVADVDHLVTRLVDGLPRGTALIITADHGQLDVPAEHRFDLDADPRLRAGVIRVAGEPRVRYLHTLPGAAGDVLATWREVLACAAWVVTREEAVASGWFGPVPPAHLPRIGDVVAACQFDYAILASRSEPAAVSKLVAFHGSATEAEMRIPLIVVRGG
jgi:Type I phosphodiesterase / nucleotide pyrophosphatase